jgi:hypothetical protein
MELTVWRAANQQNSESLKVEEFTRFPSINLQCNMMWKCVVCNLWTCKTIFHLAKTLENKSLLFGFAHDHLLFDGSAG